MNKPSPFRFKQFTVRQDRAAMKVGFDGILLGAWASVNDCECILDVGTGTGLIALMLAQRASNAVIDAVDVEQSAAIEAAANFFNSPWGDRLRTKHNSFESFALNCKTKYDLIVCNPPYFDGGQKSCDPSKALARHADALDLATFFEQSAAILADSARIALIIPTHRESECRHEANRIGCVAVRELRIRSLPKKPCHRVLLEFTSNSTAAECVSDELTVEQEHHVYTEAFRTLARDFYLAF